MTECLETFNMKTIVHAFTFFNEVDFLVYKLFEVGDVFDHFIIVEGDRTFSGIEKPFHLELNKERFRQWWDKIIYIKVDDFPETDDPWVRERHQRNAILRGISVLHLDLFDDDILIIGDLDEIPDPTITRYMKQGLVHYPVSCHLRQHMYYYNFNCKSNTDYTTLTYFEYKNLKIDLKRMDLCDAMRQHMDRTDLVYGWHLSFFGGVQQIQTKLKAYSHCKEYPVDSYTDDYIMGCIDKQANVFEGHQGFDFVAIRDNPYLPPNFHRLLTIEK